VHTPISSAPAPFKAIFLFESLSWSSQSATTMNRNICRLSIEGRSGRLEYVLSLLCIIIPAVLVHFLLVFFEAFEEETSLRMVAITAGILFIFPSVRRLHDLNKSGFLLFIPLILPFLLVFAVLFFGQSIDPSQTAQFLIAALLIIVFGFEFYLLLTPGTPGVNRYGNCAEQSATQMRDCDDEFYNRVAIEMQEKRMVPGVWARAFSDADGDENRAKAIYIKLRVSQLVDSDRRVPAPMGGDPTAVSWETFDARWVKNMYENGDVTMTDKVTGNMWLFNPNLCGKMRWLDALEFCSTLDYAGYSDWALPDRKMLKWQFGQENYFPGVMCSVYWARTSNSLFNSASYISFEQGRINDGDKRAQLYVWPVRYMK
jgi:uncharacterized membrane protein YhaH (DUF805 family)